jgi:thiamine transport system permease protein
LWQIIPLLPMAISSVVIGWGMSLVFRRGNAFLLILMQVAIYWPIAFRQIQNGINKIPTETLLASKILSKDDLDTVFRIFLPSCKKFLWAAFCCSFAISLGDTTLPLVLSVQGLDTLALYTYRLAGSYRFELACASGTIMALLSIVLYGIGEKNNDE